MLGGLLASAGLILSSFATRLEHLYLALGVFTGIITVVDDIELFTGIVYVTSFLPSPFSKKLHTCECSTGINK